MKQWPHPSISMLFQHHNKVQICVDRSVRKPASRSKKHFRGSSKRCCNWHGSFWVPSSIQSEQTIFQAHTPLRSVTVSIRNLTHHEFIVTFNLHEETCSVYKTSIIPGGTLTHNFPTLKSIRIACGDFPMPHVCSGTYSISFSAY